MVASGNEPPMFTQHFRGWDETLAAGDSFVDPYETKLTAAKEAEVRIVSRVESDPMGYHWLSTGSHLPLDGHGYVPTPLLYQYEGFVSLGWIDT